MSGRKGTVPEEVEEDVQFIVREVTVRFMTNRDDIILKRLVDENERLVYWIGTKSGPKPEDPVPATDIHTITDQVTGTKLINTAPKCLIKKIEDFNNITFFIGRTNPAVMRHLEKKIRLENEKDEKARKNESTTNKISVNAPLLQPKKEPESEEEEEEKQEEEPALDEPTEVFGRSRRQRKPRKMFDPSDHQVSRRQSKSTSELAKKQEEERKKEKLLKKVVTVKKEVDEDDLSKLNPSDRYMVTKLRVLIPDSEENIQCFKDEASDGPTTSSSNNDEKPKPKSALKSISKDTSVTSTPDLSPSNGPNKKKPIQRKYVKATMSVSEKKKYAEKRKAMKERIEKLWATNPKKARRLEKEERKRQLLEPDPDLNSMDLQAANCDECITHHGWVDECFIANPKHTVKDRETCSNCSALSIASLPPPLCIRNCGNSNELSIYAFSDIKAFTQFGPVRGDEMSENDLDEESEMDHIWFLFDPDDEKPRRFLNTEDEIVSNWCRFLRYAEGNDYNIILVTRTEGLFLVTNKDIPAGQELKLLVPYFGCKHRRLSHAIKSECHRCERNFSTSINYQKHWHVVHPLGFRSKKVTCKQCGAITHTQKDMVEHMKRAHNMGIKCEICDTQLKDHMSLKNHMKQVHPKPEDAEKCEECGVWFPSHEHLRHHRYNMHSNLSFTCMVCYRNFSRKQVLRRHMKIHTMDYHYSCDRCGKSFRDSGNLKNHLLSHSGVRAFRCEICDQGYATKGGVILHYKNSHNLTEKDMPEVKRVIPYTYEACLGETSKIKDKKSAPLTFSRRGRQSKAKLDTKVYTPVLHEGQVEIENNRKAVQGLEAELGHQEVTTVENDHDSTSMESSSVAFSFAEETETEGQKAPVETRVVVNTVENTSEPSAEGQVEGDEVILTQDHTYDQQQVVDHNVELVLQDHTVPGEQLLQNEEVVHQEVVEDSGMHVVLQDHAEAEQAVLMLTDYPGAEGDLEGDMQPTVYISVVNEDGQVVLHAAE